MAASPSEYLNSALGGAGLSSANVTRILTELTTDDDGSRMLACLAIDVHGGVLEVAALSTFLEATASSGRSARIGLGELMSQAVEARPDVCLARTPDAMFGSSTYASVMKIEKFVFVFRSACPATVGASGVAAEIDFLRSFGRAGSPEDTLSESLRGYLRPITWITRTDCIDDAERHANGDGARAADYLVEHLGLPWESSVRHDVVVVNYPPHLGGSVTIGQPTSYCEVWESPGIFVTNDLGSSWGQTCGRALSSHQGLPERVHGAIASGALPSTYYARYLGPVVPVDIDRTIARAEAERRWATISAVLVP